MTQGKAPEWAKRAAAKAVFAFEGRIQSGEFSAPDGNHAHEALKAVIALALSQAYERGQESMRERAAVAASGNSRTFDFQRALAECRDSEYGHMSARVEVAKAIRSLPIEQEEVKG